jgi:hypothetical protein
MHRHCPRGFVLEGQIRADAQAGSVRGVSCGGEPKQQLSELATDLPILLACSRARWIHTLRVPCAPGLRQRASERKHQDQDTPASNRPGDGTKSANYACEPVVLPS